MQCLHYSSSNVISQTAYHYPHQPNVGCVLTAIAYMTTVLSTWMNTVAFVHGTAIAVNSLHALEKSVTHPSNKQGLRIDTLERRIDDLEGQLKEAFERLDTLLSVVYALHPEIMDDFDA